MSTQRTLIVQGEHAASGDPNACITTILGSCVSCCLWDDVARVGGMNHMLLAVNTSSDVVCNLAGINAMELLINDILKLGGQRNRLRAKAFGGARMVSGLSDIGQSNISFTLEFLKKEEITCEGHSFGGTSARNIKFWPASGKVMQKISSDPPPEQIMPPPAPEVTGNGLELF